jgi:hypothetical protein
LVNSAQDLRNCLPYEQHTPVDAVVGRLQAKWKVKYITKGHITRNYSGFNEESNNVNRNVDVKRL